MSFSIYNKFPNRYMNESKKLAITGANGFLGQHTIKNAVQEGWEVIGIVRREEVVKQIELLGAKPIIIRDFDINALTNAFKGCKAVIHFANIVCGSKDLFKKVNIDGTRTIVEAARKACVSRIIYPSGLGVDQYGKVKWANNEYFRSKSIAEQVIREGEIPYILFRPSYILGPNDELIPEIIEQIVDGMVLIAGDGKVPIQPIFVEDATKAFLAAASGGGENNQIYELVGPEVINMLRLVEIVHENMVELGFKVPFPRIKHIPYEKAAEVLDLCQEMIDVMQSDITSDGNLTAKALGFTLSNLNKAIRAAIIEKMTPKEYKKDKNAIILLSGGIDSATALFWAHHKGYNLIAITFNYSYRPENERKAALKQTQELGIEIIEIPIKYLKEAIELRIDGFPVPSVVDAPEGFIPSRNLVFYSNAAYYAEVYGCKYIIGGHLLEDASKFPDASTEFFNSLETLINKGKHEKDKSLIKFLHPLLKMNKSEVLKLAKKLNVPFEWTWSCYYDGNQPCGVCSSCRKRKEAFNELNYLDPVFSL
ncbi:MAG: 7-cyano-7-deazaguanine synthase QueC [Candidatus Hodarchaeota archaeon]